MVQKNSSKNNFFLFAYWHDKNWKKFVGATVKIWDLAHNISNMGHEVVLFLPKYRFEKHDIPFKIVEIPIVNLPILGFISFNIMLTFVLMLKFAKSKPEIIYVRRGISIIPLLYSKLKNLILVFEVNDNPYRKNETKKFGLISFLRYRLSVKNDESYLKSCNLACIITEEIKDILKQKIPGIQENKLIILPSGSNTQLFRPLSQKNCRSTLKFDVSNYYIGFIGTLLYYSGIEILIEAVPYIRKELPNCFFLVIGEGPKKKELSQLIEENGLQDCFWLEGQVKYEALPQYINSLDLCVAPFLKSVGYSSPVKIFDYLACQKPVIASRIAGTTEIFEKTGAIKLIEPENPKILAETVIHLLKNKKLSSTMAKEGRRIILEKYDRKLLTEKLISEIRKRSWNRININYRQ